MQNGRQIDLSAQVERVKRRTRPWKAIIALLFAIAAGVLSHQARHDSGIFSGTNGTTNQLIAAGLAVAFLVFGSVARTRVSVLSKIPAGTGWRRNSIPALIHPGWDQARRAAASRCGGVDPPSRRQA